MPTRNDLSEKANHKIQLYTTLQLQHNKNLKLLKVNKWKYNGLLSKYNETNQMNVKYKNSLVGLQNRYKETQRKYNLVQQKYNVLQTANDSNSLKHTPLESDYKITNESYTKYYASMQKQIREQNQKYNQLNQTYLNNNQL